MNPLIRWPQQASGWLAEKLVRAPLPPPMARWSVGAFARAVGASVEEAEKPMGEYLNIGEFFARRLKPETRPLGRGWVHVSDGRLTEVGEFGAGTTELVQAKGIRYQLGDLIQGDPAPYRGGGYLVYYLSPRDYHRVHVPWDGVWLRAPKHVPGYLWPVNGWGVRRVPGLFAINERMVMEFQTPSGGRFAVVMVAALNVGGIELLANPVKPVERGEELGVFHLGSSVVVVVDEQLKSHLRGATAGACRVREGWV